MTDAFWDRPNDARGVITLGIHTQRGVGWFKIRFVLYVPRERSNEASRKLTIFLLATILQLNNRNKPKQVILYTRLP